VKASDVEKSVAFYRDFLGYAEQGRLRHLDDGSLLLALMKVSDDQWLEIFDGARLAGKDRLYQVALHVDDAEAMRLYLAKKDFKVPAALKPGQTKNLGFTVNDPRGYIIEFVQYRPEGWTVRDKGKFLPDSRISDHISHAGVVVEDVAAANHFYADVLGFKETWRGAASTNSLSWINLRVPDGTDYVEYMLRTNSDPHFCLVVPDMERAKATLEKRAYRATYARPLEIRVGKNRKRQLNLFDPDGIRVELMEPDTVDGQPAPSSDAPLPSRNQ
jgi:lactoylglutathione lyase